MFFKKTFIPLFLLGLSLLSCSIKENRDICPCALRIELSAVPGPVSLWVVAGDFQANYHARKDTVMVVQVPKGKIRLQAVSGADMEARKNLRIPVGFECPPVYLYSSLVDTGRDSTSVSVSLNKHFCTLSLDFDGPPGWGEPYWAEVRGNVGGLSWEGTPDAGTFSCRLDAGLSARLPRQDPEEELWLDIAMPDRVVRSFALGSYMLQAGYDWRAPDLDDMPLEIRLSVTEILLQSHLWSQVVPINMDI